MKSNISEFCSEFSEALFPLAEALGDTVHATESLAGGSLSGINEGLSNIRHRLESLINKVQGQEAYVLLFGPLKSGKSTLINAISGGYVSEVSSLPAYPCMVYLKYGPEPSYSVIRYSGKSETIESAEALKDLLQKSHRTLSDRIRAMEDFGEDFDPAVDFTQKYDIVISFIDDNKFVTEIIFKNSELTGGLEEFKMVEIIYTRK